MKRTSPESTTRRGRIDELDIHFLTTLEERQDRLYAILSKTTRYRNILGDEIKQLRAAVATAKTAREYTFKADQWNHYQITADGDHIVVALNGETTLDIHDAKFSEGHLRLQYQQFPIAFRNIKIRSLP